MNDDTAAPGGAPAATTDTVAPTSETETSTSYETLGEDDVIIEQLKKEARTKKDTEVDEAKPPVDKTKDKDKSKDKPAASKTKFETPDAAVDAITKAFETGDVETLSKLTGKPKSFFDLNNEKWATFREKEQAVRIKDQAADLKLGALDKARKEAQAEFGTAIKAAKAYQDGDYEQFAVLVAELAGEDYDTAQRKVIEGAIAVDPATKELRKLVRDQAKAIEELKNPKAKDPERPSAEQQAEMYRKASQQVASELEGHAVTKIKGFERMVLDRVRDSYSDADKTYTLGFSEAADQVIEERKSEALALGIVPKPVVQKPTERQTQIPPRGRAADARAPDGEPWLTQDLDDDDIIASLERDRKAGRLK